jgi:hypothetical protein
MDPYFDCVKENSEQKSIDARYCTEPMNYVKVAKEVPWAFAEEPTVDYDKMNECAKGYDMPLKGI